MFIAAPNDITVDNKVWSKLIGGGGDGVTGSLGAEPGRSVLHLDPITLTTNVPPMTMEEYSTTARPE